MLNLKRAIACLFIFVGGFGIPTAGLSLLNPFGAKIYDANDPLGSPVTAVEGVLVMSIYVILLVVGIWLAVSGRRQGGQG